MTGSSKRVKREHQQKSLPMTKDEPGFSWYKRACCESTCGECGIDSRLTKTTIPNEDTFGAALLSSLAAAVHSPCDCEFRCLNDNGAEINVVVKVKMYTEQVRSGGFQKEMEEVEMTLSEFKEHFVKCAQKYLVHHFNDIMSSQARRNLYEKMATDVRLKSTVIIASDYSAILDGHSQDQLNQTIQLHSIQLVLLLAHLSSCGVLMTKAYSLWTQQGTSKLKSDNHFYRQCVIRALNDVRADAIPFDKVVQMTDGAPTQFKNRFNAIQLCNLVRVFDLDWAMAVYPPTATFKGEHDGVGNLDKRVIRQSELAETGRYPTTRSYLPLLLAQPEKTPHPLDHPDRATHEIDKHVRVYVTDTPEKIAGDDNDHNILVTDKLKENYECSTVPGIQSSYNMIAFKNLLESGAINTRQTVYLRDGFCSCDNCRGAIVPEDFGNCRYESNDILDPFMKQILDNTSK
jgi:hypothetical protein